MNLYEPSFGNIWTDPYVQQQLLRAHLDASTDAASRQAPVIERTVEWITSPFAKPRRAIDLGCGPGLYSERLAARGWTTWGIDLNRSSLDHAIHSARSKGLDIHYREGSYLDPLPPDRFNLAICIYCDVGALTPDQRCRFLSNVRERLDDDGTLVFDVFGPGIDATKSEGTCVESLGANNFWSAEPCEVLREVRYFPSQQVWGTKFTVTSVTAPERSFVLWDHTFTADSLAALLETSGFTLEEIRRDLVTKNDFTSEDVLFARARKTKSKTNTL